MVVGKSTHFSLTQLATAGLVWCVWNSERCPGLYRKFAAIRLQTLKEYRTHLETHNTLENRTLDNSRHALVKVWGIIIFNNNNNSSAADGLLMEPCVLEATQVKMVKH